MALPYKIVIFDIDNTLTESRSAISSELSKALSDLIDLVPVALISGESIQDFNYQIISHLTHNKKENLFALPTSGAELHINHKNSWRVEYSYPISDYKRRIIYEKLAKVLKIPLVELDQYIYDRGSQITYSALGKHVTLAKKYAWDPKRTKRQKLVKALKPELPGVNITIGGSTSIDFTENGIDKAFGISKLLLYLGIEPKDALFVGDSLEKGGNDEPAKAAGVDTRSTSSLKETESIINGLIKLGKAS